MGRHRRNKSLSSRYVRPAHPSPGSREISSLELPLLRVLDGIERFAPSQIALATATWDSPTLMATR